MDNDLFTPVKRNRTGFTRLGRMQARLTISKKEGRITFSVSMSKLIDTIGATNYCASTNGRQVSIQLGAFGRSLSACGLTSYSIYDKELCRLILHSAGMRAEKCRSSYDVTFAIETSDDNRSAVLEVTGVSRSIIAVNKSPVKRTAEPQPASVPTVKFWQTPDGESHVTSTANTLGTARMIAGALKGDQGLALETITEIVNMLGAICARPKHTEDE